ncbi:DUF3488 and transglutaminase-like domain-containing protein [Microbacterium sp. cx-55]|uniref:transglutaminase TgpA family protein n=1 Tax=Microbacterium sp. cx-55 TaxID=2875948 RepID=UPI001CBCAAFC|nr:DUF3488 and transglutaminase-like domain-containing protein [Microbacterium sp. cx-55]MBZ4487977.1 DUF3488 and transglutaminase-like domain-containing protein [Microbacterium sp. cx-55]UGB34615.1 DUF3488 and transglutaminase-like domain-containing protein [Microbacterium sp. cx-55]
MSRPERARRGGTVTLALGVLVALFATTLPVLRVVSPGTWTVGAFALAAAILAIGALLRRIRTPAIGVTIVQLVIWVVALTAGFFRAGAWFFVVPSPNTIRAVGDAIAATGQEISVGVAPLVPSPSMEFFMVAAVSLLAIVLDHVVITTRMPLLAAVALVSVALVPAIAVPAPMDVGAFALLGLSILFLLRTETRTRVPAATRAPRSPGASVAAAVIGVAAVMVAVVVTPLLPAPADRSGVWGSGGASGIDPTLSLGEDLRRPNPVEVLRVRTSDAVAPYLRAVTLSTFAGDVWEPDDPASEPLAGGDGFGPLVAASDILRDEDEVRVDVSQLNTPYLPVPFPATSIEGLTGEWGVVAENRTVIGLGTDSSGQDYAVSTEAPRPTLPQIRAAASRGSDVPAAYSDIPTETPSLVTDLARQVTEGTSTDYDAVAALQTWFRSSEFSYSLDAPVEDGFDGEGVEALEQFLITREGYCVHYASAFAVMARSLGMPTRIVIGYLPGRATSDTVDDETVYSVTSDLLHAWPEVYFEGIGWVAFEPTNSLGAPPVFASGGTSSTDPLNTPAPTSAPSPTASAAPTTRPDTPDTPAAGASGTGFSLGALWPGTGIVVLAIALLLLPALARALRRTRQRVAARAGDAVAAWSAVQSAAIDLGIPVPPSESPRAFGARLVGSHGADADAVHTLVAAVEQASYAPADAVPAGGADRPRGDGADDPTGGGADRSPAGGDRLPPARRGGLPPAGPPSRRGGPLAAALAAVTAGLRAHASPLRRGLAVIAPRSLVVRPGSASAGGASPTPTR